MTQLVTSDSVVVTGGLGDLITLESHMTAEESGRIERMYLATPAARSIMQLIRDCPAWFPSLEEESVKVMWNDWGLVRALHAKEDLYRLRWDVGSDYREAQDLSIRLSFRDIMSRKIPYTGSQLLRPDAECSPPAGLPDCYICVHPGTDSNDYGAGRNMTVEEWVHLVRWLQHTDQYAVVIGSDKQRHVQSERIVDIQGQTTIAQTIQVLRGATSYIGIDSWLSVLAAQLFGPLDLTIKSVNQHLYIYKRLYYTPHRVYPFIRTNLLISEPDEYVRGKPTQMEHNTLACCYRDDVWYHPQTLESVQYDDDYFAKYQRYERSELGHKLASFRTDFVQQYCPTGTVLDFGIGSGDFMRSMWARGRAAVGHDVMSRSRKFLADHDASCNPWIDAIGDMSAVTFWDTLEHLIAPTKLLARLAPGTFLFVSMPCYPFDPLANGQSPSITQWKHYRPGEHYLYFTAESFQSYLNAQGFDVLHVSDGESKLGRQDILTFVSRKSIARQRSVALDVAAFISVAGQDDGPA